MNSTIFTCFFLFFSLIHLNSQSKPFYIYDLINNSLDSIPIELNTDSLEFDSSPFSFGNYNDKIAELPQNTLGFDLFPNSAFTLKFVAEQDFDLTDFPIRTSVKLFYIENGNTIDLCSGSMISEKHVLTAAHCFLENNTNNIQVDSILACPIYNYGQNSSVFDCSLGAKLFFVKDWNIGTEDITILELVNPIGKETGWLGIEFNNQAAFYDSGIYHKFSYPNEYLPFLDSTEYNGDTLYYSFGKADLLDDSHVGSLGARGIPGESGSSLIRTTTNEFTSHGVLSFSTNLRHTRIRDWMYYTIVNKIINNDIINGTNKIPEDFSISLFPNPVHQILNVHCNSKEVKSLVIFNNLGQLFYSKERLGDMEKIDLSTFGSGIYYLNFQTEDGVVTEKIVKY